MFAGLAALLACASARAEICSIVIDAATGRVLEQHHADARHYPASLSKMMTLYLTFEALREGRVSLNQRFYVSPHAAAQEPTKLGLRPGQRIPLRDLILGIVTQSANDAAVVIAEGLAGSEPAFAREMTRKARELGMNDTVFRNASGLPIAGEYTTARDMARLAQALLHTFPRQYRYFSTREFRFEGQVFRNHNHLLGRYPGLDGIKTGFTDAAGFNLAASAVRRGRRLIAVIMGDRTWRVRDRQMVALLNASFRKDWAYYGRPTRPTVEIASRAQDAIASFSPISSAEAAALPTTRGDPLAVHEAGPWSVQVGAYARWSAAEAVADRVVTLSRLLSFDDKHIVTARDRRRRLYVVRFNHLTEADATSVCDSLKRQHQPCFVRAPAR